MKKNLAGVLVAFLLLAGNTLACITNPSNPYEKEITSGDNGVSIGGCWASNCGDTPGAASLSWNVYEVNGLWHYEYEFNTNSSKGNIRYWILELSKNIEEATYFDILEPVDGYLGTGELQTFWKYGYYKFSYDSHVDAYQSLIEIVTSRAPMMGDFYALGEKDGCQGINYFLAHDAVLVPDTKDTGVPIPGAFLLLGSGLLFVAGLRKKLK